MASFIGTMMQSATFQQSQPFAWGNDSLETPRKTTPQHYDLYHQLQPSKNKKEGSGVEEDDGDDDSDLDSQDHGREMIKAYAVKSITTTTTTTTTTNNDNRSHSNPSNKVPASPAAAFWYHLFP